MQRRPQRRMRRQRKYQNVWKGQPDDESGQLQSLAGIRPSRICPSSEEGQRAVGRGKAQKSTRTVLQLCERGKAGASRGRRGRRGNRAVPEQELQPSTTRDRRRSPTGGALTLPTPVREVGMKARSGAESSEKLEKRALTRSRRPSPTVTWYGVQGMANDWSLLLHPVEQSKPSKTQSYNTKISGDSRDRQSLRKNLRVPIRKLHQEASEDNMGTETERFLSHSLSSRGAYLWETPSRGHFTTLSDGGRLILNLFSNNRVGRAAQSLGVRAAFWNLKFGEQYDVIHLVNLRRVLRDVLGCMMFVPSAGWNVARDCSRPFRSSAQPWRIEKSRVSMSPSDLACLDTGNRITGTVIKLALQCQRFHVPWAIESPEKSLCWTRCAMYTKRLSTSVLLVLNGENVQLFWPAAWTRLTCGLLTPCAVVGTNDAVLLVKNTCNSLDMTPLINAHVHTEAECTL